VKGGAGGPGFVPVQVAVVTISDTRTVEDDGSGQAIVDHLVEAGHEIGAREIIPDDLTTIRGAYRRFIDDPGIDVVISSGGTGITRRDVTPEALAPLVTKAIPGFGELFRWLSFAEIGASTIQSRSVGALCSGTLIFALPGSPGAVELAMGKILVPQLDRRTRPCNFVELLPRIRG
jgi:molybdopterin adenylyltransferase